VLEYNVEAGPSKFLIGTEGGTVLTANKKPKKDVEITTRYGLESGRHLGPVYALNRSIQNPKYFLSVGDWSTKIWVEDLKVPIIRTKYHGSYLSDGMWSPTRPGAFFLARRVININIITFIRMVGWMFGIIITDKMKLLSVIKFPTPP